MPHLGGVAIDGALSVLAAKVGVSIGDHAAGIAAVHHPGSPLCWVLPHRMHGQGLLVYAAAWPHAPLKATHAHVFTVESAATNACGTTTTTSNADLVVLGHIWAGRLAGEARLLGNAWTLWIGREKAVTNCTWD